MVSFEYGYANDIDNLLLIRITLHVLENFGYH